MIIKKIFRHRFILIWLIIIGYPAILSLKEIISGSIPFWFDPARDFLLALENLHKITLIGSPTGIPGLFYGPYWIWAISAILIFSKDPRIVTIFVMWVPYFLLFPLILIKLGRLWNVKTSIVLWLLFILNFRVDSTFLWNPRLAPLFLLALIYLVYQKPQSSSRLIPFCIGALAGLIINFHFSFGIACFFGTLFFLLVESTLHIYRASSAKQKIVKKEIVTLFIYAGGAMIIMLPLVFFELRHNFLQTKSFLATLQNAFFYNSAMVGQVGLSKVQIVQGLFSRLTQLTQMPLLYLGIILLVSLALPIKRLIKKQQKINFEILRITGYVLLVTCMVLLVFISSKNPVWEYHFTAVEILWLFLIGLLLARSKLLQTFALVWVIVMLGNNFYKEGAAVYVDPMSFSSLANKVYTTNLVLSDAPEKFNVFVYSPALYTYDFDYLFLWKTSKFHKIQTVQSDTTYLIIPKTSEGVFLDFINYRTSANLFRTVKEWTIPDGTTVIKRQKKTAV
jgi:hypothetical protein